MIKYHIRGSNPLHVVFRGYPSYLEINYKIHIILIVRNPKQKLIFYPFNVRNKLFYDYFERKSYY